MRINYKKIFNFSCSITLSKYRKEGDCVDVDLKKKNVLAST